MAVIQFVALRSIASGYAVNDSVTFAIPLTQYDEVPATIATLVETIGGAYQNRVKRDRTTCTITTVPYTVGTPEHNVLKMFVDSVRYGEPFSVDPNKDTLSGGYTFTSHMCPKPAKPIRTGVLSEFSYQLSTLEVQ